MTLERWILWALPSPNAHFVKAISLEATATCDAYLMRRYRHVTKRSPAVGLDTML